jgi:hypothetical protein
MLGFIKNLIIKNKKIQKIMEKFRLDKTPEQVQKSISAALDSVNLIGATIAKPATDKTKELVDRNVKHCELMLTKDWFVAGLVGTQKADLEAAVAAGKAYTA